MILSCPGKTFLLGEYVALDGGPSLLLATAPRFQLYVRAGAASALPFHPDSPAGKFAAANADELNGWTFEFRDPYSGKGGLGASSAQFALMWAFVNSVSAGTGEIDFKQLMQDYRACAWNGEGVPPSGADVVCQLTGDVTWFDGRSLEVEALRWPFGEIGFTILRTGQKLATHEHLREGALAPHATLRTIVLEARKAFATADDARLIEAVNAGSLCLRQSGLTAPYTTDLLDQMRDNHDLFLASKGCGAMGADTVVALHSRARAADVVAWARGRGLELAGALDTLTSGLEILQAAQV